mmetsp:Transcript_15514/g.36065  ORF Transcript_15514/g.36065 Transcript_15514/m.36065 type:complete len:459 (-) Transcript_15514:3426-4802(-)
MRVGELGGEEELEVVRPVNLLIAELDELLARLDRDLFLEDRVEHRVDVLADVLKEEGVTVLNRELEVLHKVRVVHRLDLELGAVGLLDPHDRLLLRVDAERVARGLRGKDTVLHRVVVGGEALRLPALDSCLRREERLDIERLRERDVARKHVSLESVVDHLSAVLVRERAGVRKEGGGEEAVAHKPNLLRVQLDNVRLPARALARQADDELGRGCEALVHDVGLGDEGSQLLVRLLEAVVELGELGRELAQLLLELRELPLGLDLRLLHLLHLELERLDVLGHVVVAHDRADPLVEAGAGGGDALEHLEGELLVLEVLSHAANLLLRDRVLRVRLEQAEEVRVREHLLRVGPSLLQLLAGRLEDHNAEAHVHHGERRLGEVLHLGDIVLLQVCERSSRGLDRGQRLEESLVGLGFLHVDLLGLDHRRRLLDLSLGLRGVGDRLLGGNVLDQLIDLDL